MKSVVILVPEHAVLSAVVDPRDMFTAVNEILSSVNKAPVFDVKLVGLSREVQLCDGLFSVKTNFLITEIDYADVVIIPSVKGDMSYVLEQNRDFGPWLVSQFQKGAQIASLCLGAFLLADTGLLDGKMCSTHWLQANLFREKFPSVHLVDEKIITDQNGLYSSGGANAHWSLLLYLVEKYTDRQTAVVAAKFFLLETSMVSQSPFTIFKGQKFHDDKLVLKIQLYIEENFQSRETVDEICLKFGIGRRTLERRFKKATNNSVAEYISRARVEASKKELETGVKNLSEIAFDIGYNDDKSFRDTFRKFTGIAPLDYRRKFGKDLESHAVLR